MKKQLNQSQYFAMKLLSIIVCYMGMDLPLSILRSTQAEPLYRNIFAVTMMVVLPAAIIYFLYQIIASKSYMSVYPFKFFSKQEA